MANPKRRYTFGLAARDLVVPTPEKWVVNPFTNEKMELAGKVGKRKQKPVPGWTPEARAAIEAMFAAREATINDDYYHVVAFPGGDEVQVYFGYDGNGGEGVDVYVDCDAPTEATAGFLFEVIRTGNMALIPYEDQDGPPALIAPPEGPAGDRRWPKATILRTPADLIEWMEQVGSFALD